MVLQIIFLFNCFLTVYFSQKRNFIDYSGYFMGEV